MNTSIDISSQYDNWYSLHVFLRDNVYGKKITVETCKNILSKFHSCCMNTTNKVCNRMLSLNVDTRGHSTGNKCEKCPVKNVCVVGDCSTHKLYCAIAKLSLTIIRARKITEDDEMKLNKHIQSLMELEQQDFGRFRSIVETRKE